MTRCAYTLPVAALWARRRSTGKLTQATLRAAPRATISTCACVRALQLRNGSPSRSLLLRTHMHMPCIGIGCVLPDELDDQPVDCAVEGGLVRATFSACGHYTRTNERVRSARDGSNEPVSRLRSPSVKSQAARCGRCHLLSVAVSRQTHVSESSPCVRAVAHALRMQFAPGCAPVAGLRGCALLESVGVSPSSWRRNLATSNLILLHVTTLKQQHAVCVPSPSVCSHGANSCHRARD